MGVKQQKSHQPTMPYKRARRYQLYFVETPSPEENCFVIAKSASAAARFEEDETGFNQGECKATYVRDVGQDWLDQYIAGEDPRNEAWYVTEDSYKDLEIQHTIIHGDDIFRYRGNVFRKETDEKYIAKLVDTARGAINAVVESAVDLLRLLKRDAPGEWLYRGQTSCEWPLQAGIYRDTIATRITDAIQERKLLEEFKRRSHAFLVNRPSSDWEWLFLAQHFGLPTRLPDWSQNPLVALYFACKGSPSIECDGGFCAYRHGREPLDIRKCPDPFEVPELEVVMPLHIDQRVIAQRSLFTIEPRKDEIAREGSEMLFWHVSAAAKARILDELELLGISESSLFPGLGSIANDLKLEIGLTRTADRYAVRHAEKPVD